jgi:hypothetical protein
MMQLFKKFISAIIKRNKPELISNKDIEKIQNIAIGKVTVTVTMNEIDLKECILELPEEEKRRI